MLLLQSLVLCLLPQNIQRLFFWQRSFSSSVRWPSLPSLSAKGLRLEADPEELELKDLRADPEVEELELKLEPLDLGLLEYEPKDLFSWFS